MTHKSHEGVSRYARAIRIFGFVSWSSLMLIIGIVSDTYVGTTKAYADGHVMNSPAIVRLDKTRLGGQNLSDFAPYEPGRGNLIARGHDYYYSDDENLGIGVWESKPGEMTYKDLGYDELMIVLDGSLVMTSSDSEPEVFGSGEGLVLPQGWSGTLAVPEGGVRKIWVSYMGGKKGK